MPPSAAYSFGTQQLFGMRAPPFRLHEAEHSAVRDELGLNIYAGTLGDSNWLETDGRNRQPVQYRQRPQSPDDHDLTHLCLSGKIKASDILNLQKGLEKSSLERDSLERQVRELQKRGEVKAIDVKDGSKSEDLVRFMDHQQLRIATRDDDLHYGYSRELQGLLQERSNLKKKGDLCANLHRNATEQNEALKDQLEQLLQRLTHYKALTDRLKVKELVAEKPKISKEQRISPTEEELLQLEVANRELQATAKQTLERLIEEQMQREIDGTKMNMLMAGLKQRYGNREQPS